MNVTIRPLQVEDARTSYKWRNDPEVWKYTGSKPDKKITLSVETDWIKRVIADESSRRFAILADGIYVGNVYLTDITAGDAQYHIFIGNKAYWGKGIAKIASIQILEFAKQELSIKEVYLEVDEENAAAYAIYNKLGFIERSKHKGKIRMTLLLRDWQV